MVRLRTRLFVAATLAVSTGGLFLAGAGQAAGAAAAKTAGARVGAAASGSTVCIAHRPNASSEYPIYYANGCTGHDEPELDPVSSLPGSARDLTWTAVLPKDGKRPVSDVGPTFWWGGTVSDPTPNSLFGQGFLEVQFYPDAIVQSCTPDGGFDVIHVKNKYSVCSPVWQVDATTFNETAAFNAELFDGHSTTKPLVMNAGDTIKVHFFVKSKTAGWHIKITDETTDDSGTIVLNSQFGPMLPVFDAQQIGNALGWGIVNDTPNSFVWEIGHTSNFANPPADFCLPGATNCDSYDTAHWLGFTPLRIKSVTFADGSPAKQWAVVSDFGGTAEVNASCPTYGVPFCTYPWFAFNSRAEAITYGADYRHTKFDYGQASQFATTPLCGGPFGAELHLLRHADLTGAVGQPPLAAAFT